MTQPRKDRPVWRARGVWRVGGLVVGGVLLMVAGVRGGDYLRSA